MYALQGIYRLHYLNSTAEHSCSSAASKIREGHAIYRFSALQGIYRLYHPECTADDGILLQPCGISLQAWIAIFGSVQLIISQLPDISSLRELNLFCTACTVMFGVGCLGMSIYNGEHCTVTFLSIGMSIYNKEHCIVASLRYTDMFDHNNKREGKFCMTWLVRTAQSTLVLGMSICF